MGALRQGMRVRIHRNPNAPPGEIPPPGVWMVLAHSPGGATHWWLHASDEEARAWAAAHPREVTSGCIDQPGNRLVPVNTVPL